MRKTLLFLLLCSLFFSIQPLSAKVHTISSMRDIMQEVDADTLLIFDIDQTLIYPEHNLGYDTPSALHYTTTAAKNFKLGRERFREIESMIYQQLPFVLVEESTGKLLEELQGMGVKMIALTARHGDQVGVIENAKDLTLDHLSKAGINFSSSFAEHSLTLDELQNKQCHTPFFEQGVIFAALHEKGPTLLSFLKRLNLNPKKIVFVDDKQYNVISVSNALDSLGIENHCFHYVYLEQQPDIFDPNLADVQVLHLLSTGRLLSDAEARSKLEAP